MLYGSTELLAKSSPPRLPPAAGVLVAVMVTVVSAACAHGQMRVETQVRTGGDEVVSANVTLFAGTSVYDFRTEPESEKVLEIVIYDSREKRFTLLDVQRQVRTDVTRPQLLQLAAELRQDPDLRRRALWMVEPDFDEEYNVSSGWLLLDHPKITYRARGDRPRDTNILPLYYEYLDECARLNATDPRKLPPFCRLRLNAAIQRHGFIPTVVEMSIRDADLFGEPIAASTHHFVTWQFSRQDQERMQQARAHLSSFRRVSLPQYREQTGEREAKQQGRNSQTRR